MAPDRRSFSIWPGKISRQPRVAWRCRGPPWRLCSPWRSPGTASSSVRRDRSRRDGGGSTTEQGRPDSDGSRPEPDRGLEIAAHAHREAGKTVASGYRGQERKVRRRRFAQRRDTHQTIDPEIEIAATGDEESIDLPRDHAGFLGFLSGVDLNAKPWGPAGALNRFGEGSGQVHPIEGLDHVEKISRLPGLVALQRPNEPKLHASRLVRPSPCRLLDAALPEY